MPLGCTVVQQVVRSKGMPPLNSLSLSFSLSLPLHPTNCSLVSLGQETEPSALVVSKRPP